MKLWKRPIRQLMQQHSIPSPESLMANMLALRIAQLPARADHCHISFLEIPLHDGRKIEVRLRTMTNGMVEWYEVTVGLPGSPQYRTVDLSHDEQQVVGRQFKELHKRSRELKAVEDDAASQHTALTILEGLL